MTGSPDRAEDLPPADLMMWVLIVSELLVFGAGMAAFLSVRITDPEGFAAAQDRLDRTAGAVNTGVLLTSGLFAALAVRASRRTARRSVRTASSAARKASSSSSVTAVDSAMKPRFAM